MSGPIPDPRLARLLATLARHAPVDDEETAALQHLRRLAAGSTDPFLRSTLPAHVTASAVVVDARTGRILLHLHRRLERWLQPGGHIEPGEAPEDAAIREAVEETGVAVHHPAGAPTVLHLDEHPGPDGHVHLDLRYLLLASEHAPRIGPGERSGTGEGPQLRWALPQELSALADRSLVRVLPALTSALRSPTERPTG